MSNCARAVRAQGVAIALLVLCVSAFGQSPAVPAEDAVDPAEGEQSADREAPEPEQGTRRMSGCVLSGLTGEPMAGARIIALGETAEQRAETTTDESGAYAVALSGGPYMRLICMRRGIARAEHPLNAHGPARLRVDFLVQPGTDISGQVVEAVSREGVPGIVVEATPLAAATTGGRRARANPAVRYQGTTDAEGRYVIEGVPLGPCRVEARTHDTAYLTLASNAEELTLEAGVYYEGVDFALTRGAAVEGVISGADGAPAAGATVRVAPDVSYRGTGPDEGGADLAVHPHETRTNQEGRFRIAGLAYDRAYQVQAMADGFAPTTGEPFRIAPGDSPKRVDLSMDPGSRVSGRILRPDGSPWGGGTVLLTPELSAVLSGRPARVLSVAADEDGAFAFDRVGAGVYVLRPADAPGNPFTLDPYSIEVEADGSMPIEGLALQAVEAGPPRDAAPSAEGAISGEVTGPDGDPAPGVRVEAWRNGDPRDALSGESDAKGRFSVTGLEGVLYDLVVEDDAGVGMLQSVAPGAEVTLRLSPPATVEGTVLDARGNPVAGASVVLTPQDRPLGDTRSLAWQNMMESGFGSRPTDAEGRFAFRSVSPGTYVVRAKDADIGAGESRPLTLAGGDHVSDLRVTLYSGVPFAGEVVDASGDPVSGAVVRLAPAPRTELEKLMSLLLPASMQRIAGTATTGADGRFSVGPVAPGDYRVFADRTGFAQYYADGLALSPGGGLEDYRIVLGVGGEVTGRCVADGAPQPDRTVLIVGEAGAQMGTTDAEGAFRFSQLAEGSYLVYAVDPTQLASSDWTEGASILPAVVDVVNGETAELTLGDRHGSEIRGVLRGRGSNEVVMASLRRPDGPASDQLNMLNLADAIASARYTTAISSAMADGAFVLTDVPPGAYILDVFAVDVDGARPGDLPAQFAAERRPLQRVHLEVGETPRELNITLSREGTPEVVRIP